MNRTDEELNALCNEATGDNAMVYVSAADVRRLLRQQHQARLALAHALEALEYHQAQTRPIKKTAAAITVVRANL